MSRKRRGCLAVVLCLLALAPILAGCWNKYETNELLIPDGFGFDWHSGKYYAIASLYNTRAAMTPGGGAGGSAGQSSVVPETFHLTGHGTDPGQALTDMNHVSTRHILWAPSLIVLIGQAAAQHGIGAILDTLTHEPWFRPTIAVMIVHGTVRALLDTRQSGPETSVSRSLKLLEQTTHFDESAAWAPRLFDVYRIDADQGRSLLLPAFRLTGDAYPKGPPFAIGDSAVLLNDRLVAWLPRSQVRMVLWMTGRFVRSTFAITCGGGAGSVDVDHASARVLPVIAGGQLKAMDVTLTARASLIKPCGTHDITTLQEAAAAAVDTEASSTIAWVKDHGYDVLGFGTDVYRASPSVWARVGQNWPGALATLPVDLKVQLTLATVGLTKS